MKQLPKLVLQKPKYLKTGHSEKGAIKISASGTGQNGERLTAYYETSPAWVQGGALVFKPGSLVAEPTGQGVGSSFMSEHLHPLFRQGAARFGKAEHRDVISLDSPMRFDRVNFVKKHGYTVEPSAVAINVIKKFRPEKPKKLSPYREEVLRYLMGTRYLTAEEAKRRK